MKKKFQLFLRDLLFFGLFFIFIGILVRRVSHFIAIHKESIIHELDNTLLAQVETTKNHCIQVINKFNPVFQNQEKNQIESMIKALEKLEEQYKKNSHGLLLLGPIGTISIVLKERTIKTKLLTIIRELYNIIFNYSFQKIPKKMVRTIEEGIIDNQKLLAR